MRILSPEAAVRALELASKPYRPPAIVELKKRIETETVLAERQLEETGQADEEHVRRIVAMKLELDGLYADWAEGKIT